MNKLSSIKKVVLLTFVAFIIILATFFHYPVQIIHALTLEALPNFDIHISIWRILFEPFMGVLLFFNRSTYPIEENQFALVWLMIFFILFSVIKIFVIKNKQNRRKFIISRLISLPIVAGLLFTLFVILIFLSRWLPSNTIINNSTDTILVTTHSHTEFSHDGLISQNDQWEWHKNNNFDAFFITDHNNHSKTLDFVSAQRKGEFPIEPLVMCGEEFSGSNHLSLLGLKRKFNTKKYSDKRVIDSVRANGGVVLVNHWFDDENKSLEYYRDLGVDGFEIENTALEKKYDRKLYHKIKDFCEKNNLIMNGGLDFHGYGNVCSIWNGMEIPGWEKLEPVEKEEAILNVVRSRDQSKLKVLLYDDRSYYTPDHLFWSPIITLINYFRTLQVFQILSWVIWIFFFLIAGNKISEHQKLSNLFSFNKYIPVLGIMSALFILVLGTIYYLKAEILAGTENDIFVEYSTILFTVGTIFIVYSGITTFIRFRKGSNEIDQL